MGVIWKSLCTENDQIGISLRRSYYDGFNGFLDVFEMVLNSDFRFVELRGATDNRDQNARWCNEHPSPCGRLYGMHNGPN